ncbi:ROK family protein [Streptomyces sp. NPDC001978]|uniref:ROK family protein n=1 Tax=Streptomyces sp. NPDC001978 TaxID=3364627 RepID=UPI003683FC24
MNSPVAVLDIGGTHATAALVDPRSWHSLPGSRRRFPLDSQAAAPGIVAVLAAAVRALEFPCEFLGVAVPGPFDYSTGIARFTGVGKFDALNGYDLRTALSRHCALPPDRIRFLNDAAAFGLGEHRRGALAGSRRGVALTLGTGVGSAFLEHGRVLTDGPRVPPQGRVDLLTIEGAPLEDMVSRRALLSAYRTATGRAIGDVADLAEQARRGDQAAAVIFTDAFTALGKALGPWLERFAAEALVVGGGISAAWDLFHEPFGAGLRQAGPPIPVRHSPDTEESVEVGTAWYAAGDGHGPA